MDMNLTYTNHKNERIVLGPDSIYHYGRHNLFDGTFEFEVDNNTISSIHRAPVEKTLPVGISTKSEEEGIKARNQLFRVFEVDAKAKRYGSLKYGDYVLRCVRIASNKDNWWWKDTLAEDVLTLLAPTPAWVREIIYNFNAKTPVEGDGEFETGYVKRYPYGYPFGYGVKNKPRLINIEAFAECPQFRFVIYGPALNPSIYIGTNRYRVNVVIPVDGLLIIDSREELEPIMMYDSVGIATNVFDKRVWGAEGSGTDIFCPIPAGMSQVYWDNSFAWDLYVYVEQGEPICFH
ncbi:MAG: hypothetical protein FWE94_08410 [Coriobacteriia bacterium]|nr:hypothetical protein [Coriobacteriia bacterium]